MEEKRLQPIHMDKLESVLLASEDASGAKKFGGPGWSRTNDVSYVTVLQTAAIATMQTDPYWYSGKGLNLRPLDYQSGALPSELPEHNWWNRLGSNQRLPGFNRALCQLGYGSMAESAELESDASCRHDPLSRRSLVLPGSLSILVMPAGLEPAISSLRGWRPSQLDDGTILEMRAGFEPANNSFADCPLNQSWVPHHTWLG